MSPRHQIDAAETFVDSDAVTVIACSALIVIDDNWLEAVRVNLVSANLSRHQRVALLDRLEGLERESAAPLDTAAHVPAHRIVIGDHFDDIFNAFEMRAPDAITAQNVVETIDVAARHLAAEGYAAALRQLVFFVSGNLEDSHE